MLAEYLREDAPEPYASRREELLQAYRQRFASTLEPWSDEDWEGYRWVKALADAGHVGAARLRSRILTTPRALESLAARDPAEAEAAIPLTPFAAHALARAECAKPRPDFAAICNWLAQGPHWSDEPERDNQYARQAGRIVAASLRELMAVAAPQAADVAALPQMLEHRFLGSFSMREVEPSGKALFTFAKWRLESAAASDKAAGEKLLERAADLRHDEAQDELVRRRADPALYARWLDPPRNTAVEQAVRELKDLPGGIAQEDLLYLKNARYLGLASGRGAVEMAGAEPYVASLFYTLSAWRLKDGRPEGGHLRTRAAELGSRRAQVACYRGDGDVQALRRRLVAGGEPAVASAIAELETVSAADIHTLAGTDHGARDIGALMYSFAENRFGAERLRLVQRAAELGSLPAKTEIVMGLFEAAADKRAFVRDFETRYPKAGPITRELRLRLGMHVEREGALEEAISWYAKGIAYDPDKPRDAEFCFAVATAFDRRYGSHRIDDPATALAWHERGAEAGGAECLGAWIQACARGDLALTPDPQRALALAKRSFAANPNLFGKTKWFLSQAAVAVAPRAANAPFPRPPRDAPSPRPPRESGSEVEAEFWQVIKDSSDAEDFDLYLQQFPLGPHAAQAREKLAGLGGEAAPPPAPAPKTDDLAAIPWLELGAFLRDPESQLRLGLIYATGRGAERDATAARACLEAAAASEYTAALGALTKEGLALLGIEPGPQTLPASEEAMYAVEDLARRLGPRSA
jgi:hypothetical protein